MCRQSSSLMGNSYSHSHSDQVHLSTTSKRKTITSRLTRKLSCISAWSMDPSTSSAITTDIDDKYSISDHGGLPVVNCFPIGHKLDAESAYAEFLGSYPEYRHTWIIDSLRKSEFSRLARSGETYVDYMGGSLYPENLVRAH